MSDYNLAQFRLPASVAAASAINHFAMNYNVAQLLKEPVGAQRSFSFEETYTEFDAAGLPDADNPDADNPIEYAAGSGLMVRTHQGIWVRAAARVAVRQECSRCLNAFGRSLSLELDEEYLPLVDIRTGRRTEPPDDWLGLSIDDDHILKLDEAIRQSAMTELPLKPLCRPDCGGICDRCGADLNLAQCDCDDNDGDPRWAALRSLIAAE